MLVVLVGGGEPTTTIVQSYLSGAGAVVSCVETIEAAQRLFDERAAMGGVLNCCAIVELADTEAGSLEQVRAFRSNPHLDKADLILTIPYSQNIDASTMRELRATAALAGPIRKSELFDALAIIKSLRDEAAHRLPSSERSSDQTAGSGSCVVVRSQPPHFKGHVLLAEDNPVNVEVAREFLSLFGCTIEVVNDGRAAIAAVQQSTFDLVMMDCQMPVMDGIAATRAIRNRERRENLPAVPIVAVTANAYAEDRDRCVAAGMNDHLCKPFTEEQLSAILGKWIRTRQSVAA
jgi:two-component system, sensor histidine kinase and response regulator